MKALMYLGPEKMELQEAASPEGDIVIKVIASGVCGTDLKTYLKGHHMFKPPVVLGHECYGEITEAGILLDDLNLKKGDIVSVAPYIECGACEVCKRGFPELCPNKTFVESGCFCEYIGINREHAEKALFKIENASDAYTLVEPLACVLNGIGKLHPKYHNALIVGGGPMGALFAITMMFQGKAVRVVETSHWRKQYLEKMSIDVVDPVNLNKKAYDAVILAVNIPELVQDYIGMVADGGDLFLFSGYTRDSQILLDPYEIHYREIKVSGSTGYAGCNYIDALDMVSKYTEKYEKLISHDFSIKNAEEAFDLLKNGKGMKAVIRM